MLLLDKFAWKVFWWGIQLASSCKIFWVNNWKNMLSVFKWSYLTQLWTRDLGDGLDIHNWSDWEKKGVGLTLLLLTPDISGATYLACVTNSGYIRSFGTLALSEWKLRRSIYGYWIILDIKVLLFTMFLFQFVKHFIETVIEIFEILLIWWVNPQYPWSHGIGSPIWGPSMTRVSICKHLIMNLYSHINPISHLK